jgi:hypothetical protein
LAISGGGRLSGKSAKNRLKSKGVESSSLRVNWLRGMENMDLRLLCGYFQLQPREVNGLRKSTEFVVEGTQERLITWFIILEAFPEMWISHFLSKLLMF